MNYAIYKGVSAKSSWGAIQFDLGYPTVKNDKQREGVVFINACSSTGPNQYNWNEKIVFALSVDELGQLLHFFVSAGEGDSLNLVHDPNMKSDNQGKLVKSLNFYTKEGVLGGGMITMRSQMDDTSITHKIPISGSEVMVLKSLFEFAIPKLLGWE